ncbi:hypothetical protein AN477_18495 [Alicyclobacillus ferrooxydans]|uniref:Peptidase S9 prolyl oligopeptidase catalytic domain-containing protein n=2 Tax=Alicyclobacillus ferrooxydans TaxID=471514 RepID=A0A0N8PNR9_9BACL|nr:hypothetical protein AN477_18495 [Alicyclobacillus ferrooxydans]
MGLYLVQQRPIGYTAGGSAKTNSFQRRMACLSHQAYERSFPSINLEMGDTMDIHEINGIPVVASEEALKGNSPLIIVIHGMSTTAETLRAGWPDDSNDGLSRIYWRLPVLREGRESIVERRNKDIFNDLFWPVVNESRQELTRLIQTLGHPSVGLFGFSIGGLISLWGGLDNQEVKACVSVGGVPHLDYLLHFYPDYDWLSEDVLQKRNAVNLHNHIQKFTGTSTHIMHGLVDDQADWSWMRPFSQALTQLSPVDHVETTYPHVRHRLIGDNEREAAELVDLRQRATEWFLAKLRV